MSLSATDAAATAAVKQHDADQAGGAKEIVFSSDGAESAPIAFPNIKTLSDESNRLDSETIMTAEEAFEVFAGKLYLANPYTDKKSTTAASTTTDATNESPLERLGRLKREVAELEKDCTSEKAESSMFQTQLAELQEQLQHIATSQLQQPTQLSASIQAALTDLNQGGASATSGVTSSLNDKNAAASLQMEARLRRLEMTLGGSNGSATSLVDRILALEAVHAKLDEKKLDALQKRGKVIRQDLEAAAKARNKLASATSSTTSAEDSKTIAALYDQLQQLQGLTPHLPVLTLRLQELAHQHVDAATRAQRFRAVEQVVTNLSQQVQSIETALGTMDESLKQNATAMQENVSALEERIKGLSY